jgi:hypothetical protein
VIDRGVNWLQSGAQALVQFEIGTTDTSTGDETYTLKVQTSNTTNFAVIQGESTKLLGFNGVTPENVHHLSFIPNGRYVRAYILIAGTTPSIVWGKTSINLAPL